MPEFFLRRGQGEGSEENNLFAHRALSTLVSASHAEAGGHLKARKRNPRNPADLTRIDFGNGEKVKLMQTEVEDGVIAPFTVALTTNDRVLVAGVDENENRTIQDTELRGMDSFKKVVSEVFPYFEDS